MDMKTNIFFCHCEFKSQVVRLALGLKDGIGGDADPDGWLFHEAIALTKPLTISHRDEIHFPSSISIG